MTNSINYSEYKATATTNKNGKLKLTISKNGEVVETKTVSARNTCVQIYKGNNSVIYFNVNPNYDRVLERIKNFGDDVESLIMIEMV